MSLHDAAQKLAKKGRGPDKALVHMSPRELQGLQALAKAKGGSLTINPSTGLPEAGFLEDILPVVAAAAATYFTAGAAAPALVSAGLGTTSAGILAGAGAGALIGGASSSIQGGDFGQGALMGGLGGALAGGMGAFPTGTESAAGTGLTAASTGGAPGLSAAAPAAPTAANAPLQATNQMFGSLKVAPTTGMAIDPLASNVPASYGITANTPVTSTTMAARDTANAILNPAAAQAPATQAATQAGGDGIGAWWAKQSPLEKAGYSTAGALGLAALNAPMGGAEVPDTSYTSSLQRISPNFQAQEPVRPNPYYRARYPVYAGGGIVALADGGGPVERMSLTNMGQGMYPQGMISKTDFATASQMPNSMKAVSDYDVNVNPMFGTPQSMARGGIADLGGYSDGGRMLKGPGDGMSDSIPGIIGNKQPARLADGEFVVPADVVSHLGNGSTDAGAKKLYAMMDKVRQARTGKKKQAPAVKTDKYLPRVA